LSWSGGKDSAMALYELQKQGYSDITLLTTVSEKYGRISMHGVRETLLTEQARSLGLNIEKIYLSPECTNEEYGAKMEEFMLRQKKRGIKKAAFGDIFLEDVRKYREKNLEKHEIDAVFPLWGRKTKEIAETFIGLGFKSIITCVDTNSLDKSFSGRLFDRDLLSDLPRNVDPCGENGEFHSFVFDGPIFSQKIEFSAADKLFDDGRFCFCDLKSANGVFL
ncbi:MAG: diphthine--ammonia ligase, partial [Bacillota bacterium]|nr:diphthine--ammonia ligase [Bacillota bacterium]